MEKPLKIPGQRDGDRAHLGTNLIHDEPLLATMKSYQNCLVTGKLASNEGYYERYP